MIKRMMWGVLGLLLSGLAVVMWADNQTSRFSRPYISHNLHELPAQKVALVLGTSPKLVDGRDNWYFNYRIQAAVELYQQGKVQHIIVSGDNRRHTYNEPDMMAAALVKQGVPANKITADYAGLRTLDSVLRARDILGNSVILWFHSHFIMNGRCIWRVHMVLRLMAIMRVMCAVMQD